MTIALPEEMTLQHTMIEITRHQLLEPAHGCLDLPRPHSRWAGNLREAEEVGETLAGSRDSSVGFRARRSVPDHEIHTRGIRMSQ